MPDHTLLDRIVRGRSWIPLLGVMLAGIVAMQVEVLKLGAGIGRSLEQGSALSSTNELLRANVASLADEQRIERLAASMGMVMPGPAQIGFLSLPGNGAARALASIHAPDQAGFLANASTNGAIASGPNSLQGGAGGTTSTTTTGQSGGLITGGSAAVAPGSSQSAYAGTTTPGATDTQTGASAGTGAASVAGTSTQGSSGG